MIKRLLISVMVLTAQVLASTYYVDPLGSNANDEAFSYYSLADIVESWSLDFPAWGHHFV
jgi:hypothetical protein